MSGVLGCAELSHVEKLMIIAYGYKKLGYLPRSQLVWDKVSTFFLQTSCSKSKNWVRLEFEWLEKKKFFYEGDTSWAEKDVIVH